MVRVRVDRHWPYVPHRYTNDRPFPVAIAGPEHATASHPATDRCRADHHSAHPASILLAAAPFHPIDATPTGHTCAGCHRRANGSALYNRPIACTYRRNPGPSNTNTNNKACCRPRPELVPKRRRRRWWWRCIDCDNRGRRGRSTYHCRGDWHHHTPAAALASATATAGKHRSPGSVQSIVRYCRPGEQASRVGR